MDVPVQNVSCHCGSAILISGSSSSRRGSGGDGSSPWCSQLSSMRPSCGRCQRSCDRHLPARSCSAFCSFHERRCVACILGCVCDVVWFI